MKVCATTLGFEGAVGFAGSDFEICACKLAAVSRDDVVEPVVILQSVGADDVLVKPFALYGLLDPNPTQGERPHAIRTATANRPREYLLRFITRPRLLRS